MLAKLKDVGALAWRLSFRSATMLWQYILLGWSALVYNLDEVAAALGDPNINQQVHDLLGDISVRGLKLFSLFVGLVSIITMAARMRSLIRPKQGA